MKGVTAERFRLVVKICLILSILSACTIVAEDLPSESEIALPKTTVTLSKLESVARCDSAMARYGEAEVGLHEISPGPDGAVGWKWGDITIRPLPLSQDSYYDPVTGTGHCETPVKTVHGVSWTCQAAEVVEPESMCRFQDDLVHIEWLSTYDQLGVMIFNKSDTTLTVVWQDSRIIAHDSSVVGVAGGIGASVPLLGNSPKRVNIPARSLYADALLIGRTNPAEKFTPSITDLGSSFSISLPLQLPGWESPCDYTFSFLCDGIFVPSSDE